MKLTKKQEFCLRYLAKQDAPSFPICSAAADEGLNTARCKFEWADAPLRQLRKKRLVLRTGGFDRLGRSIHAITDAGISALGEPE